jgi:hypothetical protein
MATEAKIKKKFESVLTLRLKNLNRMGEELFNRASKALLTSQQSFY